MRVVWVVTERVMGKVVVLVCLEMRRQCTFLSMRQKGLGLLRQTGSLPSCARGGGLVLVFLAPREREKVGTNEKDRIGHDDGTHDDGAGFVVFVGQTVEANGGRVGGHFGESVGNIEARDLGQTCLGRSAAGAEAEGAGERGDGVVAAGGGRRNDVPEGSIRVGAGAVLCEGGW